MSGQGRSCSGCGLPLSRYNPGDLCQACINASRKQQLGEPAEIIIDGRKLAELRRKRGMTQHLFADRAGLSASLVQKLEANARRSASLGSLHAIARALNVPLNALLEGSPEAAQADGDIIQAAAPATRRPSPAATNVPELCDAVTSYSFDTGRFSISSTHKGEIPPLRDLERDLRIIFDSYQASWFTSAASRLPALLADAQFAVRECKEAERGRARRVLALSYQAAASVLTKSGDSDLALLASERGLNAAQAAGEPPVLGSLIRSVAFSLLSTGRLKPAMRLIESGATALEHEIATDDATLSVYGMLFLAGSMASARSGDGPKTADYLEEAGDAARRLGKDANYFWTAFGPTNVAIHQVNTAVELGDIKTVLGSGLSLHTEAVPAERRVRYLLDVARVHSIVGNRDDALGTMLAAERIAPEHVRQHYLSGKVVMNLIRSARGKPSIELDKLSRRVNAAEPI